MALTSKQLLDLTIRSAEDKKAMELVALDLQGVSIISDYFVICHGNSDIQVQAIANEIRKNAHSAGVHIRGTEGMNSARWVLLDMGDVVVHIFHREERDYYKLERLWSDAKVVNLA